MFVHRPHICSSVRAEQGEARRARLAINGNVEMGIAYGLGRQQALHARKRDALRQRHVAGQLFGSCQSRFQQLSWFDQLVDQAPVAGAFATDTFRRGAEEIGAVAAHFALIHQPRQPAGAGQHSEQRQLGQRDRAGAIIRQHDVIAG